MKKKVKAVKIFPTPKHVKNVREFLELSIYYRRFIDKFADIACPLNILLQKDQPFVWKTEQQASFDALKNSPCTAPVLRFPDFDKPFEVML